MIIVLAGWSLTFVIVGVCLGVLAAFAGGYLLGQKASDEGGAR